MQHLGIPPMPEFAPVTTETGDILQSCGLENGEAVAAVSGARIACNTNLPRIPPPEASIWEGWPMYRLPCTGREFSSSTQPPAVRRIAS